MTFEDKIKLLASTPPGKTKQELLNKFTFGDKEFASRYYVDAVTLEKYMEVNRHRFLDVIEKAKQLRFQMSNKGWTEKKYQKYLGEIPAAIMRERPEFSSYLPKKQREANIRMFFQKFPEYRVDK